MLDPVKKLFDIKGPKVAEALNKRHFEAYYLSNKEDAVTKILELQNTRSFDGGGLANADGLFRCTHSEKDDLCFSRSGRRYPTPFIYGIILPFFRGKCQ